MNRWLRAISGAGFRAAQERIRGLQKELAVLRQIKPDQSPKDNPVALALPDEEGSEYDDFAKASAAPPERRPAREVSGRMDPTDSLFPVYVKRPRLDVMVTCFLRRKVLDMLGMTEDPPFFQLVVFQQDMVPPLFSFLFFPALAHCGLLGKAEDFQGAFNV